ncbi:MAG: DUF5320 domain-containing protein [Anaerolineae bacterium]|nr:DUF5320 domain-containing protein [Anaerolineae bacterium]
MPGFDKTGPEGAGAKTGWGEGDCDDVVAETTDSENVQPTLLRPMRRRRFFSRRSWPGPFGRGRRGRGRRGN